MSRLRLVRVTSDCRIRGADAVISRTARASGALAAQCGSFPRRPHGVLERASTPTEPSIDVLGEELGEVLGEVIL